MHKRALFKKATFLSCAWALFSAHFALAASPCDGAAGPQGVVYKNDRGECLVYSAQFDGYISYRLDPGPPEAIRFFNTVDKTNRTVFEALKGLGLADSLAQTQADNLAPARPDQTSTDLFSQNMRCEFGKGDEGIMSYQQGEETVCKARKVTCQDYTDEGRPLGASKSYGGANGIICSRARDGRCPVDATLCMREAADPNYAGDNVSDHNSDFKFDSFTKPTNSTEIDQVYGGNLEGLKDNFANACGNTTKPNLKSCQDSAQKAALDKFYKTSRTQKEALCTAADSQLKGADGNGKLSQIWGVIALTCTTACAVSSAQPRVADRWNEICSLAMTGGTVATIAISQDFQATFKDALFGLGGQMLFNSVMKCTPERSNSNPGGGSRPRIGPEASNGYGSVWYGLANGSFESSTSFLIPKAYAASGEEACGRKYSSCMGAIGSFLNSQRHRGSGGSLRETAARNVAEAQNINNNIVGLDGVDCKTAVQTANAASGGTVGTLSGLGGATTAAARTSMAPVGSPATGSQASDSSSGISALNSPGSGATSAAAKISVGSQTLSLEQAQAACSKEGWQNAIACAKSTVKYNLPAGIESPQFAQQFAATIGMPLDQALAMSAKGDLKKLLGQSAGMAAQKAAALGGAGPNGQSSGQPDAQSIRAGVEKWESALGLAETKAFGKAISSNSSAMSTGSGSMSSSQNSQAATAAAGRSVASTGTKSAPTRTFDLGRMPKVQEAVEEGFATESQSIFQVVSRRYFLKTNASMLAK